MRWEKLGGTIRGRLPGLRDAESVRVGGELRGSPLAVAESESPGVSL